MYRNLKILHVSESFGWSGGAAQALALAARLQKYGYDNAIACPRGGDLWKKAAAAGLRLFPFKPRRDYDLPCAVKLAALLNRRKPEILHAHHPKAHAMCLMAKAIAGHKPVLVVTRRVSHPLIKTVFARLKYKSSLIDGYIAVAGAVRRMLVDYGLPPRRVRIIYSGVDSARFKPGPPSERVLKELALPQGAPALGLIGNFSRDKGQHVFVEAAARLLKEGLDFTLIFAGRETDSAAMKKLLAAHGVPPEKVRLLGLRHDVPELLSVMTLSVNAAVKGEALSGSIRESMAAGVPVIASDIAGNGEIVIDGKTGLLFPSGDSETLYRRLKYALSDPGTVRALAVRGLEFVRENFTVEAMVRKTLLYYSALLLKE
ncbi:MAG: glycosyltransferase [Elusimicrobia bacterium]|nr:glycosyltransferase [Elusimicrobiota bacterium]